MSKTGFVVRTLAARLLRHSPYRPRLKCIGGVLSAIILVVTARAAFSQNLSTSQFNAASEIAHATEGPAPNVSIISSAGLPTEFDGVVINLVVGADRFYNAGYIGSSAIVANVESGAVWNGQETLTQVNTYVNDTVSPGPQTGEFDLHATWVGAMIDGHYAFPNIGDHQIGISPGATLWSGSIATQWDPPDSIPGYSTSFEVNLNSFANVYKQVMVTGVNGQTADVVNSSWGFTDSTGASGDFSRAIDALVAMSGKTFVTAAGNGGPADDTVSSPGAGYNKIAVAALTSDTSNPVYGSVADFSSRGPSDVYNPATNQTIVGVRASVDIAAPGTNMVLAFYGGPTGGNNPNLGTPLLFNTTENDLYSIGLDGTSFSTPIVAGGATLVVDAARTLFGPATKAIDGRVVKAVLLNSADKIAGWNNGQAVNGAGVIETKQSLDYSSGAGALDLNHAYDQLTAGTTEVPGLAGGPVQPTGWDYGRVQNGAANDYPVVTKLAAGSTMTVTLDWFNQRTIDLATNATAESEFSNLDLQVWRTVDGVPTTLVATSDSQYNNVEHLYFQLPSDDFYLLRVLFDGVNWNLRDVPDANLTEDYGLAWSDVAPVPEPSALILMVAGVVGIAGVARRRARMRACLIDGTATE